MRWSLLIVFFTCAGAGCAVAVSSERASGGDGERHLAQPQALNKMFLDSVDYDGGDGSDWRYMLIGQRGLLTVTCHFDNVHAKTAVTVRDAVGNVMATQYHNGEPKQEATVKVKPGFGGTGRYYVEIKATEEGATTPYTCEGKFEPVVW